MCDSSASMVLDLDAILKLVHLTGDVDDSTCRLLLSLCLGVIVILACVLPFLLRASYLGEEGPDETSDQEKWQNQEWQSRVHRSCEVEQEGGSVVLVTGAAGFIGLHVCLALKRRGDGVVGLDSFSSATDLALKRDRQKVLENSCVFVVHGDINDAVLLGMLFDMVAFTHVMHLAAEPGIRSSSEIPAAYVHNNIAGLVSLLEACRRANPQPAFVWTSSSSVYGPNTSVPYSEGDPSDEPASLYAASKKAGEGLVYAYNHTHGLSATTLRLGTVYGPWGRSDMAYWIFVRDIIRGKPITIYEGPNQANLIRDWTFVDDIVEGCLAALDSAEQSTGSGDRNARPRPAQLRTFNLGCQNPVTVVDLVNTLERHLQIKAKVRVVETPLFRITPVMYADISLARLQLGYNPATDPYEGLKKFVDWYLDYNGIAETESSWKSHGI